MADESRGPVVRACELCGVSSTGTQQCDGCDVYLCEGCADGLMRKCIECGRQFCEHCREEPGGIPCETDATGETTLAVCVCSVEGDGAGVEEHDR